MSETSSYYRPYESDDDAASDTGSETSSLPFYDEKHAQELAGPNFATFARQLAFQKPSPLDFFPVHFASTTTQEKTETEFREQNNILLIDSRDRDRKVFPQPTAFTIRLPRTYKNVTNIQLAQIKLLSAFFYFRADKYNISFPLYEQNRTTLGGLSTITNITIREGSYTINDLLSEIQLQCNNVPLFFDYPNGFTDFSELFTPTGDLTLNFNQPGDTSYDREHDTYVSAPTMAQILNRYFPSNTLAVAQTKPSYSLNETRIAYYYPVLKELVLDTANPLNATLNLSVPSFTGSIIDRILYNFQGFTDTVVLQVIIQNLNILDEYRTQNTFLYRPVNQYYWNYDTANSRVFVTASNLNNSLVTLLQQKYNFYLTQALTGTGITTNQYNLLVQNNTEATTVFNGMYRFLQRSIASNWGITYGTYSPEFYVNFNNVMFLQNSCNLNSNEYKIQEYNNAILAPNISTTLNPPHSSPNYWPRLIGLPDNLRENTQALGFSYVANEIIDTLPFTDNQGFININKTSRSIDVATTINATKYTYFKFRSPIKQNLQVETLPRPLSYRYQNYNAQTYSQEVNLYFDLSYSFVQNAYNINMNNLGTRPLNPIGQSQSAANIISVLDPVLYYTFTAPAVTGAPVAGSAIVKYPLTLTFTPATATFEDTFVAFVYHDAGVFNADILNFRAENENHYKFKVTGLKGSTTASVTFNAVAKDTYYVIVRSQNQLFNSISYKTKFSIQPSYTIIKNTLTNFNPLDNPLTAQNLSNYNYATVYDPDILRLPSYASLYHQEPQDPLLGLMAPKMGADSADVSDDLTDYRPYISGYPRVPTQANLGGTAIDPINKFTFQYLNAYNQANQVYITPTVNNKVLDVTLNPYTVSNVERDYKIVQWNSQEYIPPQTLDPQTLANISPSATPFNAQLVTIPGYDYNVGPQGGIKLGNGVIGFTFLATDGIWNMEELWFKSAVVAQPDPNAAIQYLGIFYTQDVFSKSYNDLKLSKAALVLTRSTHVVSQPGANESGGTYYLFKAQTLAQPPAIYGYTQNSNTMLNNPRDLYCVIAFSDSNKAAPIYALAGSTVPYPAHSQPTATPTYFGVSPPQPAPYLPTPNVITPVARDPLTIPPEAGPAPKSIYVSQYEQSIPIITTGIQYLSDQQFIYGANALAPYRRPINADGFSFYWENQLILNAEYMQSWDYNRDASNRYLSSFSSFATYTWTLDEIYSPWNSQAFASFATTSTSLYLLGIQETAPGPSVPYPGPLPPARKLLIQEFTKADGVMRYMTVSTPTITEGELVQKFFVGSNSNSYVISTYDHGAGLSRYYINPEASNQNAKVWSTIDFGHDLWKDPASPNIYVLPYNKADDDGTGPGGDTLYSFPITTETVTPNLSTCASIYYILSQPENILTPVTRYRTVTVDFQNNIFLWSGQLSNRYEQITGIYQDTNLSNNFPKAYYTNIRTSIQTFNDEIVSLQVGFGGSLWVVAAQDGTQTMYGGVRSQTTDTTVTTAWQIFYPCFKARFLKKKNYLNTITDLDSSTGNINTYPEFYHPQLFFYSNWTSFSNDCANRFAQETAGRVAYEDLSGSGYNFNSYLYNIELDASTNFDDTDPDSYYYLVLRGYSPTEQFQTMTRFFLPQRYDYGYRTIDYLIDVIGRIGQPTETLNFNPDFSNSSYIFDRTFSTTQTYGENVIPGFAGSTITTTGFSEFMGLYSTFFTQINPNIQFVNGIASNVESNLNNFINRYLTRILPSTALARQNIVNSIPFTLGFKSGIGTLPLSNAIDNWGLGWNLGFEKKDYSGFTYYRAPSFYKIIDEYIYLQMNPEFNMNRLDLTSREDLSKTRDAQGNVNQFAGKLLLTGFATYTTSLVQNGANFNPPIDKLDKLQFTWTDVNGNQVNNFDSEWDASLQITENVEVNKLADNRLPYGFLKF